MENIKLIYGDCLKKMDKLIKQKVLIDCVITDLPYGTSSCSWDTIIPFDEMWDRIYRLVKPNAGIILFGTEPFSSALRMSNIKHYKYDWKWEKSNGSNFLNNSHQPLKVHEDILVFTRYSKTKKTSIYYPQITKGKPYKQKEGERRIKENLASINGEIRLLKNINTGTRQPRSILRFNLDKEKLHPTQKPIKLLMYLIKTYTKENELVLDFTMGSGSTGVACKYTNRRFIGIENNKEYFDIAKKRITKQLIPRNRGTVIKETKNRRLF
jgi:site-specific DNA-methyltransferase (adenine-specific)